MTKDSPLSAPGQVVLEQPNRSTFGFASCSTQSTLTPADFKLYFRALPRDFRMYIFKLKSILIKTKQVKKKKKTKATKPSQTQKLSCGCQCLRAQGNGDFGLKSFPPCWRLNKGLDEC